MKWFNVNKDFITRAVFAVTVLFIAWLLFSCSMSPKEAVATPVDATPVETVVPETEPVVEPVPVEVIEEVIEATEEPVESPVETTEPVETPSDTTQVSE